MLLLNFTPQEKATIVVNAITDKIKLAPKRFDELIKIFSDWSCTKDIVNILASHEQDDEHDTEDCDTEAISSSEQGSEGHVYTAWENLNPDDKLDLEAKLIMMLKQ